MSTWPGAQPSPDAAAVVARLLQGRARYLRFLGRRVPPEVDAADLLQQGLLRAVEHAGEVRDPARVDAWFYRVLRRLVMDARTEHARRTARLEQLRAEVEDAPPEAVAACGCGLELLGGLRPEYADIVRKVDLEDAPLADAARAAGITVNNAGVRLHRARRALRRRVLEACGTGAPAACADCACGSRRAGS